MRSIAGHSGYERQIASKRSWEALFPRALQLIDEVSEHGGWARDGPGHCLSNERDVLFLLRRAGGLVGLGK